MKDVSLDKLKKTALRKKIGALEEENWPWIDFIWSGFARAGRVGHTIEGIYELLSRPEGMQLLIRRVADILRTEFNIPFIPKRFEDDLFRFILKKALKKGGVGSEERADPKKPAFNDDLKEMTRRFMGHYMKRELLDEGLCPATNRSRFIFGHTHKPFLAEFKDNKSRFGKIAVVNSGGCVIESDKYWPNHAPGIVIGTNTGDMALVQWRLDVKSCSQVVKPDDWGNTLDQMDEHQQLADAISKAVAVRRRYFKERVEKTKKILKSLSK